ncbi:molybdopterin synthase catalytic subunit MoaE [Paludibacterium yongneupense]|uniref:molybdopterin synthase catalytic subunit MoaE n=1 Tax=Paludibacterium yongneupense TaxID=400061 RepID=UPI000404E7A1|nr:molybdopterin synthase catalytic subunit MoaE [Paludibacterium yongneupense]
MARIAIRVQEHDFDVGAEYALLAGIAEVGAIAAFVGQVRELPGGGLSALTLEHYPGMTEKMLARIADAACERWPLDAVTVIHRFGRLEPCARIVLVLVASAHRHAAFEACEYVMDYLKTEAPFWKKESAFGKDSWVEAHASDEAARERWHAS